MVASVLILTARRRTQKVNDAGGKAKPTSLKSRENGFAIPAIGIAKCTLKDSESHRGRQQLAPIPNVGPTPKQSVNYVHARLNGMKPLGVRRSVLLVTSVSSLQANQSGCCFVSTQIASPRLFVNYSHAHLS
jgi:hypothetical protein